jgi:hypothetical protein
VNKVQEQSLGDWLAGLQPGDTVMIETISRYGSRLDAGRVVRLTKTQVVLDDGAKYALASGREVGTGNKDPWGERRSIAPVHGERLRAFREKQERIGIAARLQNFNWNALSLDQIRQVAVLLSGFAQKEEREE